MLRSAAPLPEETAQVVARVRNAFSDLELTALAGDPLPFDARPLLHALATRLRLALVLQRAPRSAAEVDRNALNELLAHVDLILDNLQLSPAMEQPEVARALEATRNAIVRDAVTLSEVITPSPAQAPAPTPSPPRKTPVATGRVVLLSRADAAAQDTRQRRSRLALAAAGVLLVAAAAFHLWNARASFTPPPTVAGAPADIGVSQGPDGTMLVHTFDGKAPSAEVLAWMEGQQRQGYRRRQLGAGLFVLERPRAAAPAAAHVVP